MCNVTRLGLQACAVVLWGVHGLAAAQATAQTSSQTTQPLARPHPAQVPAASTLSYLVRKGVLFGEGQLQWLPQGARYTLSLSVRALGIQWLQQTSTGTLNAYGLVPEVFSDQRPRGPALSATLDAAQGLIRYAGLSETVPWVVGTQDRLSWMLQLPAVVQAQPRLHALGQELSFYVSGARGDAEFWTFECKGREDIRTPGGVVSAVKWLRQPHKPKAMQVEVWLDPARQWLPVQARLGNGAEFLELSLRAMQP